jgi:hypothetical protein
MLFILFLFLAKYLTRGRSHTRTHTQILFKDKLILSLYNEVSQNCYYSTGTIK